MLKLLLAFGALCALALLGYQHRDRLSAGLKPAMQQLADTRPSPVSSPSPRKCVDAAGRVLYTTDAACPSGQREQALRGDTVNVVRLPAAAPSPAEAASALAPLDRIDLATRR